MTWSIICLVLCGVLCNSRSISSSNHHILTPLQGNNQEHRNIDFEIPVLPPLPGFLETEAFKHDIHSAETVHPILLQGDSETGKASAGVQEGGVARGDEQCTMCQYFVQQLQADTISFSSGHFTDPKTWLLFQKQQSVLNSTGSTNDSTGTPKTSFLETSYVKKSASSYGSSSRRPVVQINLGGSTKYNSPRKSTTTATTKIKYSTSTSGSSKKRSLDDLDPNAVNSVWGGRERAAEVMDSIPREMRYISPNYGLNYANQYERQQWIQMYYGIYSRFWQHCRERVPLNYLAYCKGTLAAYPLIMQGLHWGDRPETICLRYEFCAQTSYLASQPHTFGTLKAEDLEQS